MDRILIILKKENGPRASSAPALGLNTIIFKYVYWYMKQISGERLQDHWSSGLHSFLMLFHSFCSTMLLVVTYAHLYVQIQTYLRSLFAGSKN